MEAWLVTEAGDKIPVKGSFSIGRASQNTLALPGDPRVSRRHALIHQQGAGQLWLVDLGSSNGVILNGRRLRQPIQLKDQDKIEVGSGRFVFLQPEKPILSDENAGSLKTSNFLTIKDIKMEVLWLLVADIENFTPLSQTLPGDSLAKMVGKWIANCKEIIESHDGIINKYLGDGFLAYWPNADIPVVKIHETIKALKVLQGSTKDFQFRMVMHHGNITVDNAVAMGENSLIGPDVNFIFRMEKIAGAQKKRCMLSSRAKEQLKAFGDTKSIGQHSLTGFGGTYEFFEY